MLQAAYDALAQALSVLGKTLEAHDSVSDEMAKAPKQTSQAAKPVTAITKADKVEDADENLQRDGDIVLRERTILPGATIIGRSATDLHMRTRYGPNLLAVSRKGRQPQARLRRLKLKSGDLLMMQGPAEMMTELINDTACVPLG